MGVEVGVTKLEVTGVVVMEIPVLADCLISGETKFCAAAAYAPTGRIGEGVAPIPGESSLPLDCGGRSKI